MQPEQKTDNGNYCNNTELDAEGHGFILSSFEISLLICAEIRPASPNISLLPFGNFIPWTSHLAVIGFVNNLASIGGAIKAAPEMGDNAAVVPVVIASPNCIMAPA